MSNRSGQLFSLKSVYRVGTTTGRGSGGVLPPLHPPAVHRKPKTVKNGGFWGPPHWRTIHCAAASYRPDKEGEFVCFLNAISEVLPCDKCRDHWKMVMLKFPVADYLRDSHSLFFWSYLVHDQVNQNWNEENPGEPRKISPPYEKVKAYYFDALREDCAACLA